MFTASGWVSQISAAARIESMTTDAILKSLEKQIGNADVLNRVRAVLECIDRKLAERPDDPVMRDLWVTIADYLEKVQESIAAA